MCLVSTRGSTDFSYNSIECTPSGVALNGRQVLCVLLEDVEQLLSGLVQSLFHTIPVYRMSRQISGALDHQHLAPRVRWWILEEVQYPRTITGR